MLLLTIGQAIDNFMQGETEDNQDSPGEVTRVLSNWANTTEQEKHMALTELYRGMHGRAMGILQGRRAQLDLEPTVLVNETYLRLFGNTAARYESRQHFLYAASKAMRHVLIDLYRAQHADKRDVALNTSLTANEPGITDSLTAIYDVEQALQELEDIEPEYVQVVEARFFAGLTIEETAAVLEMSPATVKRKWAAAQIWLNERLS